MQQEIKRKNMIKFLLASHSFTDMEISHEEFITISNEKDKYEKMKEGIRSMKSNYEGRKIKTTEL